MTVFIDLLQEVWSEILLKHYEYQSSEKRRNIRIIEIPGSLKNAIIQDRGGGGGGVMHLVLNSMTVCTWCH